MTYGRGGTLRHRTEVKLPKRRTEASDASWAVGEDPSDSCRDSRQRRYRCCRMTCQSERPRLRSNRRPHRWVRLFSHPYDRKDEKDPSGPPVFSDPYGSPSSQFDGRVPARSHPAVERPGNGFRTSLTGRTGKRSVLPQGVRTVFSV